jgi:hypothetical protein
MNRVILQAMDPSLPAEPKPIYDQQQWKEIQEWEASEKQFLEGPLLLLRKRPLRQLSLGGWDSSDAIRRISQHMGTLTHVEAMIGHVGRWSSVVDSFLFDAGIVIKNCPLLQYFKMSSVSLNFAPLVIGPWVPAVSELDAPFCCRHLETLILQGLVFKSQELKDVLSVSPNLKVLKVINRRSRTPDGTWGGHSYNAYRDLLQHLERVGLMLKTLHYSDQISSRNDHIEIQAHPYSNDWTFCAGDLLPELIRDLQTIPNVVTTLELLSARNTGKVAVGLHTYLCSSPHLIHLRAPRTPYPVALLDINNRYSGTKNKMTKKGGIWMCRKLETLHLGFEILPRKPYPKTSLIHARLIFGYISRVLPYLQEVRLHDRDCRKPTAFPTLSLKSGFCLLARMKYLRHLWVGTFEMDRFRDLESCTRRMIEEDWSHLNWMFVGREDVMRSRNRCDDGRRMRSKEVKTWRGALAAEEEEEEQVLSKGVEGIMMSVGGDEAEEVEEMKDLRKRLKNVGMLVDVKNMIEEIDGTDGFVSCTNLERVDYCSPRDYLTNPEF